LELYAILRDRVVSQSIWFARHGDFSDGIAPVAERYRAAIDTLTPQLSDLAPAFLVERMAEDEAAYRAGGVPAKTAKALATLPVAGLLTDVQRVAETTDTALMDAAQAFFAVTEAFGIGRIVRAARDVNPTDYFDGLALNRAVQSLHHARRNITRQAVSMDGGFEAWMDVQADTVARTKKQMSGLIDQEEVSVSRITVAANILGDLVR
ncbi:MAG: NAD-glutamate dehydrogenase, partial [Pseudomonadota bacterium]